MVPIGHYDPDLSSHAGNGHHNVGAAARTHWHAIVTEDASVFLQLSGVVSSGITAAVAQHAAGLRTRYASIRLFYMQLESGT